MNDNTPITNIKPTITTERVSQVVFSLAQIHELIRTHYGADVVPPNAEIKGHYPKGSPLEGLVFTWRTPA